MLENHKLNEQQVTAILPEWVVCADEVKPLTNHAVVVKEGRIADLLPIAQLPKESDLQVLHFPGASLVPGLIDAHVHLTCDPRSKDLLTYHLERSDDLLVVQAMVNARKALEAGITTVRDLGARNKTGFVIKKAVEAGIAPGPHILIAGRPLTCPRGHTYFMNGEVANRAQMLNLIDQQIHAGADATKVIATGGGLTPGSGLMSPHFNRSDIAFAVEESHKRNRHVAAHVAWAPVIQECAEVGVDTLEHCTFVTPDGFLVDDRVLGVLEQFQPYIVTTKYQFYLNRNNSPFGSLKTEVKRTFSEMYVDTIESLQRFREAGLKLVAGSDAGIPHVHFDHVIGELELLVQVGYGPLEALQAATASAADAIWLGSDRGRIRKDFRADLLLVQGAVHEDISVLRNRIAVLKDGRFVVGQYGVLD